MLWTFFPFSSWCFKYPISIFVFCHDEHNVSCVQFLQEPFQPLGSPCLYCSTMGKVYLWFNYWFFNSFPLGTPINYISFLLNSSHSFLVCCSFFSDFSPPSSLGDSSISSCNTLIFFHQKLLYYFEASIEIFLLATLFFISIGRFHISALICMLCWWPVSIVSLSSVNIFSIVSLKSLRIY